MEKEKNKVVKAKKASLVDSIQEKVLQNFPGKVEITKKKHKKSNSNVEEFAFGESKFDEQLQNFVTNYDDLINGIKNTVKVEPPDQKPSHNNKTKSDGQLNVNSNKLKLNSESSQSTSDTNKGSSDPNFVKNFVSQVDEKIDIKNLTNIEEIKDYYEYTENCLQLISKLKMPSLEEIEHLRLDLPEKIIKKKLAIFDLDETLIHCELKNPQNAEKLITIKLPNGTKARIGLNIRPHILPALEEIMKNYTMIIYTASDQSYADSVIGYIDPMKSYFKYRLYRQNCVKLTTENGMIYVKDLRIIRNVPLSDMIIIDNSVLSFAFHLNNGIPILPFYSNKDDIEMNFLKNYLTKLAKYDNLIDQNGATFNLKVVLEQASKGLEEDLDNELNEDTNSKTSSSVSFKVKSNDLNSSSKRDKTDKNLVRTKKIENLEFSEDKKPIPRRKSKIQTVLYETMEKAKKSNK